MCHICALIDFFFTVIKSVSPTAGSNNGGTVLTITGENFDDTESSVRVTVGGKYLFLSLVEQQSEQLNDIN